MTVASADEKPWIALAGNREIGRFFTRFVASHAAQINAQARDGLIKARHNRSDEEWTGTREGARWTWRRTKAPRPGFDDAPAEADVAQPAPPLRRFRQDVDG
jgi:hypothetical protein